MLRVLVVEDDKYLNKLISDRLLLNQLEVVSCLDGETAWEELQSSASFDLLLLDMLLPRMMGAELLSRINENPKLQDLRKIAISGVYKDENQIREISQLHNLESYWTKPFDLDQLIAGILKLDPKNLKPQLEAGSLHERPIERIYYEAYEAGFTGKLVIRNQGQERRVYYINGHPVAADSNAISESFGSYLVSSGQIPEATREEASRRMVAEGFLFGEMLVRMGVVTKDLLFSSLRKHTYHLLLNSFLSRQGNFEFQKMESIPAHLPRIEFNPFLLMLVAQSKLLSFKALTSLIELKEELVPHMETRVGQLIPLLNLKTPCNVFIQNIRNDESLMGQASKLPDKERESVFRVLYLFESIQLLRWVEKSSLPSQNLDVPHVDFSPLLGEEKTPEASEIEQQISAEYMDTLNKNYFEILGVPFEADETQIDEAYRSIRFQKHPDRYGPGLSGQSKRIIDDMLARLDQAYQTLSNAALREEYLLTIKRMSESSIADSKKYLEALDLQREGQKLLEANKFEEAKSKFEKAYEVWRAGVEYRAYAIFAEFKIAGRSNDRPEMSRVLHKLRELAYSHLQSEICFILLGHAYKSSNQTDAAREAYRKALELNVNSAEAANSLAALAEKAPAVNWNKEIPVSSKSAFKGVGYLIGFILAGVLAYAASQLENSDKTVLELDTSSIQKIFQATQIRHKGDTTKIYFAEDILKEMPDAVLKSKCVQSFEKLKLYGSMRIYLIVEGKGLAAMCTDERLQRY